MLYNAKFAGKRRLSGRNDGNSELHLRDAHMVGPSRLSGERLVR